MTETTQTKHYRIRKEIVWIGLAAFLAFAGYQFYDYQKHLNWPPRTVATYQDEVAALKCDSGESYLVSNRLANTVPKRTLNEIAIDKRFFFDRPQCAAAEYLIFEGSGVRLKTYVYDVEKKRRTATIVTTFDKYEE